MIKADSDIDQNMNAGGLKMQKVSKDSQQQP